MGPAALLDRVHERDLLDRLLDDARAGTSRALLVRGEAGIGKTALVRYAAARATAFRVARVGAVEAEMELPFAGLHQLCTGMDDELERLPGHQRDALRVALGQASGDTPDQFLVGLAVLDLVAAVAERRPLCCLVEDVQWLDVASAQVLGFVARRLVAESVALVVTVRDPGTRQDFAGVAELRLEGLPGSAARALLTTTVPGRLDDAVCDRIVAETGGNPLALLELPGRMTAAELAGGFALAPGHGVPSRIEQHYRRRIEELPEATRTLMLVAAADPSADAALVWRAAPSLGLHPSALVPAQQAELLQVGARVRFRHPLVRSAAYQLAPREERQRVHRALALVSDPDRDADRRAWHRALAAPDVDDGVADELERSAGRAQARGGLAAAAAFLQRAAALTGAPGPRARRSLAAAQASLRAGDFETARGLLTSVEAGPVDELDSALAQLLRAQVTYAEDRGGEASQLLLDAASRLEPLDARLARDTYLEAWGAALFAGDLARSGSLLDVSRAASVARRAPGPVLPSDLLLEGLSLLFTAGLGEAAPRLRQAVSAFAGDDVRAEEVLRWGWLATRAASVLWDHDDCTGIGERAVQVARESGALEALAVADNALAQATAFGGDLAGAALLVAEVEAVREATGTRIARHGALVLAALRGQEAEALLLVDAMTATSSASGQGTAVQYARWATAVLMNGLGRYPEALAAAVRASATVPQMHIARWALSEVVEAATRSGDEQCAQDALERLRETTAVSSSDWALGVLARCEALVAPGPSAEQHYRAAVAHLGRSALRPELARAHLLYGEWLRRAQRRTDARTHLRAAHELCTEIGMDAFADRARRELSAVGDRVSRRPVETRNDLTPQERHIAQLARAGLSNAEIGARLYLSARTVEWHLGKVFAKLGVGSRRELAATALVPATRGPSG